MPEDPDKSDTSDDTPNIPEGEVLTASKIEELKEEGVPVANAISINEVTEKMEREDKLEATIRSGEGTEATFVEYTLLSSFELQLDEIPDEPSFENLDTVVEKHSEFMITDEEHKGLKEEWEFLQSRHE